MVTQTLPKELGKEALMEGYITDRNGTVIPARGYYVKLRRMVNHLDGSDSSFGSALADYFELLASIGGEPLR